MRVITGTAKGHRLKAPKNNMTRPMLDRVKEALFSVLEFRGALQGCVLDLYAGTGALGIECLSRGADMVDFVERDSHVCRIIRENLEHTKLAQRGRVHCRLVAHYIRSIRRTHVYDIIFADPPYADLYIETTIADLAALQLCRINGLVVIGHSQRVALADAYGYLHRCEFRRAGDSCFSIYEAVASL